MIINQQIKKYRLLDNMTQDDLAKKMHVSRQSISKWEQGESYPTIDNLVILSQILHIPLEELVKGKLDFPDGFEFGKPESKFRVFMFLLGPCILIVAGLFGTFENPVERLYPIASGLFIFLLQSIVRLYNYHRYHSYFVVERNGIEVDVTRGTLPYVKIIKGIFNKREGRFIPYRDIESIELSIETRGYKGSQGLDYRKRQNHMNREEFYALVRCRNQETYKLDLDVIYYSNTKEYQYFYPVFKYFEKEGIQIIDPYNILESIHQEYDFLEEAYRKSK
ncbi:helix-turn-helix domain-containing protein [Erysipelothrix urinaevulpis]|uniref:helix-turn-helix domain-containing protein n=1 Tax=Erysipelothrix urinaevulpis TaxID=2683717 RepID=UPI0013599DD5|nr:helix-turn-helix transcriptional regulator [Erysipelothrix urinaevulpis]